MCEASRHPLISVIMGVYYCSADVGLLLRSVNSILGQTLDDLELLICDDGSSDEAMNALNELAICDDRIRILRKGMLFTLPQKLNYCLDYAEGRYIARMDDDDWSYPDRLEKQLAALEKFPEEAFVGSNVELWCNGRKVGARKLPEFPQKEDFLLVQPFIHPALMFRAEALKAYRYSESRRCLLCEDYDLLLRMYADSKHGMNLQNDLLRYSVPASGVKKRKMRYRFNECATRLKRFSALGMMPKALPYVVKPIVVGLIPDAMLRRIKEKYINDK